LEEAGELLSPFACPLHMLGASRHVEEWSLAIATAAPVAKPANPEPNMPA